MIYKMLARLHHLYQSEIQGTLAEQFGLPNHLSVPRIEKIVINMGVGEAANDKKHIDGAVSDLTKISGQKPLVVKARRSVATFKLREGMPIGVKVTLRKKRMYEFLDRFITIALPRVRDFRGLSNKSFDGRGNFSMGLKEQIVFPEIDYDQVNTIRGMDIVIVTSANNDDQARILLSSFGMPFPK